MRVHPLKRLYGAIDQGDPKIKIQNVSAFPRIIELEITNNCNFQCLMCPTGTGSAERTRGFMEEEVFRKIIDEISRKDCALKFVGQGEATLHPNFLKYLRLAKEREILCHLTTNGSTCTEQLARNLVKIGLDSIKFSFQGVNAEGYHMLRRKKDFEGLLGRIGTLYRTRGDGEHPFITIGTSILTEMEDEVERFRERCINICDKVEVGTTSLQFVDPNYAPEEDVRLLLSTIKEGQSKYLRRYNCCHQVFDVLTVHWNGNVCACCADINDKMVLGNIKESTLEECWNSEKEKGYRKILAALEYEKLPVCKDCFDVYGWTYNEN